MFKYFKVRNMNRTIWLVIAILVVMSFFYSCTCSHNDKKRSTLSRKNKIQLIKIQRFDRELFSINIDSIQKYVPILKKKYGEFFDIYNYKIIQLGSSEDPKYPEELKRFITDYYMNLNYQRVNEVYTNVNDIETSLNEAFSIFHEYFPEKKYPRVYTCISGWNQSVFTADTVLGVALDKYLGRTCDFYDKLGLANYMKYTMQREYIVPDCIKAWGYTQFELKDSADNVLNNLLYEGKMIYFMKKLLPDVHDTTIFGFRPDQLKWCENNLKQMWTYLAEHKMLFSTDYLTIRKLFYPAPFTAFYTNESPGRATTWLGYKIIEAYIKNNKDITLPQLMNDSEYQKILRNSKFNP
jgi:hypothetical protein